MANLIALSAEILNDPLSRNYSAMSTSEIATSLNLKNIQSNRSFVTGQEVADGIDGTEYVALSDAQKSLVVSLTRADSLDPFGFLQVVFVDVFGGTSNTISALAALRVEQISRADELDLGTVTEGDVGITK